MIVLKVMVAIIAVVALVCALIAIYELHNTYCDKIYNNMIKEIKNEVSSVVKNLENLEKQFYAVRETSQNVSRANTKGNFINEKNIEQFILTNDKIKSHIENVVINMLNRIKSDSLSDDDISKISDLVLKRIANMQNSKYNNSHEMKEWKETFEEPENKRYNITNMQFSPIKKMYATLANEEDGVFYDVYETHANHDDVIFEFEIYGNGTIAKFSVCNDATKKILDTPDFLNGACKIQRLGNNEVITQSPGEAVFSDNKWKVKKTANVILK